MTLETLAVVALALTVGVPVVLWRRLRTARRAHRSLPDSGAPAPAKAESVPCHIGPVTFVQSHGSDAILSEWRFRVRPPRPPCSCGLSHSRGGDCPARVEWWRNIDPRAG